MGIFSVAVRKKDVDVCGVRLGDLEKSLWNCELFDLSFSVFIGWFIRGAVWLTVAVGVLGSPQNCPV